MLCSPTSNISFDVHEDQVLGGFSVEHPTCDIIFDEYVWESKFEQQSTMKDDLLPPTYLPHIPDIFHDFGIPFESCENSFYVDVTTFNHSQNKWNSSFPFQCGEKKYFFLILPILLSILL